MRLTLLEEKMDQKLPHRRLNQLTGDYVLVSPHRATRPWSGQQEETAAKLDIAYDKGCYLCPGNTRVSGHKNPDYKGTYVFQNDTPAILDEKCQEVNEGLFQKTAVTGTCRVICYSEHHSRTMADMGVGEIQQVIETWRSEFLELGERFKWVQIFENKGAMMGCSNPHPHGQIWASNHIPNEGLKEDQSQLTYQKKTGKVLLLDYIEQELCAKERIVVEGDHWVVVVPYWAAWPFETLITPKQHLAHMGPMCAESIRDLAHVLQQLTSSYDNLFGVSFPYSFGWHNAPTIQESHEYWQLHGHFYGTLKVAAHDGERARESVCVRVSE